MSNNCSSTLIPKKKFLKANNVLDLECFLKDILKKVQAIADNAADVSSIPAVSGHTGQFLVTDGTTYYWCPSHLSLTGGNFEVDTISYKNPLLKGLKLSIWLLSVGRFIYEADNEFTLDPDGGFTIDIVGFDSSIDKVEVFVKSTTN